MFTFATDLAIVLGFVLFICVCYLGRKCYKDIKAEFEEETRPQAVRNVNRR
ncbi:hypothetical protein [Proteus phage 10]|uniref:hypothetical protein n=1 Tax=Proteus TaxID=583 RepID=UPI0015F21CE7|nr:hypothetical protein [Proteus columbae]QMP24155.1 hypothetical protein [Proteus phage 10]